MAIRVKGQRIQYAHPPESIAAAKLLEIAEHSRNCAVLGKDACRLGEAKVLCGEQPTFADKLIPVEVQIIVHIAGAENGCKLGCQELRQRLDLIAAATGLIKVDAVILPDPALSVVAVRTKLR